MKGEVCKEHRLVSADIAEVQPEWPWGKQGSPRGGGGTCALRVLGPNSGKASQGSPPGAKGQLSVP